MSATRGRPRRPWEPKSLRRPGQPRKRLADDPQRHLIAALQVYVERGAAEGISERKIAETLSATER